jgi:hypothetical protein
MAKRKAPTKTCPKCEKQVHARTLTCDCGHQFKPKKSTKATTKPTKATTKPDDQISMSSLVEAKKLVDKLGGIDNAKKAIELLGKLTD